MPVRFERYCGAPDLPSAFGEFVVNTLAGQSLDENWATESAGGEFPDFKCLRGLLLIEMKHLETDQEERINEILRQKIDPAEMPFFYGARDGGSILDSVSNGEAVGKAILGKLSRTIETTLRKANRQFVSYCRRNSRKNCVSICVILNSKAQEFTPDVVLRAVHHHRMDKDSRPRFPMIDAVVYISEKHYQTLPDGRVAFAVAVFQGYGIVENPWKKLVVDHVVQSWCKVRSGEALVDSDRFYGFKAVQDIPPVMKRHDLWRLQYQRAPYMQALPLDRLRVAFHRSLAVSGLTFIKGSWPKSPEVATMEEMRKFTHLMEEINRRGLDLRLLDHRHLSTKDKEEVYKGLPDELVAMLDQDQATDT